MKIKTGKWFLILVTHSWQHTLTCLKFLKNRTNAKNLIHTIFNVFIPLMTTVIMIMTFDHDNKYDDDNDNEDHDVNKKMLPLR